MTGNEIKSALIKLQQARSDHQRDLMRDYDAELYYPACKALRDQCPHESKGYWQRNGVGWSWQECKFCGTRMREDDTDTVGGVLENY